jgi:pantoate--beta-alanine ligase
MQIIRTKSEIRNIISSLKKDGKTIGLVPTMGALHDGHLSLVDIAKNKADIVVVSIFVNPAQFAPNEDFDKYPRNEESDVALLKASGVDIVYLPSIDEIYIENSSTNISIGDIGKELEGAFRPHFFNGVALIVTKLFMQITPDVAIFGKKDYQQFIIIKKLAMELDIAVEIIGAPICRESDGLAMSSRNIYLSKERRAIAPALHKTMQEVAKKLQDGGDVEQALLWGKSKLLEVGFDRVDYIEIRNADNLTPISTLQNSSRLLAVAVLGGVRLLDNIEVAI